VKSDFWILTSNLIFFQLCEPNNIWPWAGFCLKTTD
jgi:hypothetical protein